MIVGYANAAVGLGGGIVCGLALNGAMVAGRARVAMIAGGLFATVFLMCAGAWTFFTEYVGQFGWLWLAAGTAVGVGLGELAFRLGATRRIHADPSHQRLLSWWLLTLALVAILTTVLAVVLAASTSSPQSGSLGMPLVLTADERAAAASALAAVSRSV
jgi:hypothetical protein